MTKIDEKGVATGFETRAREVFDASVDALDAQTRSRLNRARQAATAELDRGRGLAAWRAWVPAGALAAVALLAVALWRAPSTAPDSGASQARAVQTHATGTPADAFPGLVASDDEALEIASDDLDFYEWLDEQSQATGNGNG